MAVGGAMCGVIKGMWGAEGGGLRGGAGWGHRVGGFSGSSRVTTSDVAHIDQAMACIASPDDGLRNEMTMRWLMAVSDTLKGRTLMESRRIGGLQYKGYVLLQSLRAAALVRNTDTLRMVLEMCVESVFPLLLGKALKEMFNNPASNLPKNYTLHRGRLYLDVAILLQDRALTDAAGPAAIRFGWADSSTQKARDWLHVSHDEIRGGDVCRAFDLVQYLDVVREFRDELPLCEPRLHAAPQRVTSSRLNFAGMVCGGNNGLRNGN